MARKDPDPPLELDPLKGGLKHNPFVALRGKVAGAEVKPAATTPEPTTPTDATLPRAKGSSATQAGADPEVASLRSAKGAGTAPPVSKAAPVSADAHAPKRRPVPAQERVTVRLERAGRGGKSVTIAEGPGLDGRALEPLAREIARGMGTGARVEGSSIVVQGHQRERLVDWLAARGFGGAVAGN